MGEKKTLVQLAEEAIESLPNSSICRQLLESDDPTVLPYRDQNGLMDLGVKSVKELRLRAFKLIDEAQVPLRVVVVGQDPYPQEGKATGLAFEVAEEYQQGIHTETVLESLWRMNPHMGREKHARDLSASAQQGVLWMNAALTVSESGEGGHSSYWSKWTALFLAQVEQAYQPVYLILGREAEKSLLRGLKYGAEWDKEEKPQKWWKENQAVHLKYVYRVHPSKVSKRQSLEAWKSCWGKNPDPILNPFLEVNRRLKENNKAMIASWPQPTSP